MTSKQKPPTSLVRSSAAEYLTFVAASGSGGVEAIHADQNVWLSQRMRAQLYDVELPTINYHLKKVVDDSELGAASVVRNFRITAVDGKRRSREGQAPISANASRIHRDWRAVVSSAPDAHASTSRNIEGWSWSTSRITPLRSFPANTSLS